MKILKIISILLIVSRTTSVNAQRTSDLGLIYGSSELYRLNLEYRKPIKEKYRLKFGLSMGQSTSISYNYKIDLFLVTDSLVIERNYSEQKLQFTLKAGLERQIKESMFSFGADILFGYKSMGDGYYNTVRELSTDGVWQETTSFSQDPFENNTNTSLRKTTYIVPGFQFNFSMDIPLDDKLFLHLFVSQILTSPISLSETIIKDPLNEFPNPVKTYIFNSQTQVGIGLRFKFKK